MLRWCFWVTTNPLTPPHPHPHEGEKKIHLNKNLSNTGSTFQCIKTTARQLAAPNSCRGIWLQGWTMFSPRPLGPFPRPTWDCIMLNNRDPNTEPGCRSTPMSQANWFQMPKQHSVLSLPVQLRRYVKARGRGSAHVLFAGHLDEQRRSSRVL